MGKIDGTAETNFNVRRTYMSYVESHDKSISSPQIFVTMVDDVKTKLFGYIDDHQSLYIERLAEAVA